MPLKLDFTKLDATTPVSEPKKRIHVDQDVSEFQSSTAYARITALIHFLCDALPDTKVPPLTGTQEKVQNPVIQGLIDCLAVCNSWIDQCPPHTGARRFGNLAFREWYTLLLQHSPSLISDILSLDAPSDAQSQSSRNRQRFQVEVLPYFTGSFGSSQRLDFGTGHELSFIAFLGTLFQLDLLSVSSPSDARDVGLLVFPRYLKLIQRLVVEYTLEPAGSHGVWGLDDHFAIPYLFGSSQLSHLEPDVIPTPASITKAREVQEFRGENLYFEAIGFINDVKKGPFWEHSPMLYDISGINNWMKISIGMRKMYNAEVLGKFPVVQHFPFGDCFYPFTQMSQSRHATKTDSETQVESGESGVNQVDKSAAQNAMLELKQVQERTKSLHVSQMEAEPLSRNADTPVPDDQPTHSAKSKIKSDSSEVPTQVPTSAPWAKSSGAGSIRPPSGAERGSPIPDRQRSRAPVPTTANPSPTPVPLRGQSISDLRLVNASDAKGNEGDLETGANVDGLEDGIGIEGLPGTKAPFSAPRTIHPAVLASMRQRGDPDP